MSVGSLTKESKALVGLAFAVGVGLVILGKFQNVSGITTNANTALGNFVTGVDDYADWIGIIVIVGVGAYLFKQFGSAN